MVAEMEAPGASASAVSRRYDVNTNLLFKWRREIAAMGGMPGSDLMAIGVVQHDQDGGLRLVPDATTAVADIEAMERSACCGSPEGDGGRGGKIKIALTDGTIVRVDASVDGHALGRVLKALKQQP